jgi:hypothetical protein
MQQRDRLGSRAAGRLLLVRCGDVIGDDVSYRSPRKAGAAA